MRGRVSCGIAILLVMDDMGEIIAYFQSQIFTTQSLPPVTNLLLPPSSGLLLTKLPGIIAGAQLTAFTPMACAWKIVCAQLPSLNSSTETMPSEDAQASRQPHSCGDQETMLTDAVWRAKSATLVQAPEASRQIRTLPS